MSIPKYPAYRDSGVEWLGSVPSHWSLAPLKHGVRLVTTKATERVHPLGLENIESWTGRLLATSTEFEGDGIAFQDGDILFGKLRPYLAKVYVAEGPGEAVGDFHVLRPHEHCLSGFLQYQMLTRSFINIVDGSTFGSKMPRASWDFVGAMAFTLPPKAEQRTIAAFLDRETAKIDALVAEQRRLMDLLKEKRQAVISHAVTKGLNPHAPMKDSGVEWLGEVPANWAVVPLRRCVSEHRQGYYTEEGYVDEDGVKLVRITDLRPGGFVDFSECPKVRDREELRPFLLRNGDFVFARTGGAGSFGMVADLEEPAAYASYLIRFRFSEPAGGSFLRWFFLSRNFLDAVGASIHGGVNQNIHAENIKDQLVALPSPAEQKAIADWVGAEVGKMEALMATAEQTMHLLSERRSALISEVVTGQIDVRGLSSEAAA